MYYKAKLSRSTLVVLLFLAITPFIEAAELRQASGQLSLLRVHATGSAYGPPADRIDVEVVIRLKSLPDYAFGFKLRDSPELPARQAMFDLLSDAFAQGSVVYVDYWIDAGKKNGLIHRVWVTQ